MHSSPADKRLIGIRGAVCAENTDSSITQNVGLLCKSIVEENAIQVEDIVSIQFTVTPDLDALNPATALRHAAPFSGVESVPLFCAAEPVMKKMLDHVVRVLLTAYVDKDAHIKAVYLNGAQKLRPDLSYNETRNC